MHSITPHTPVPITGTPLNGNHLPGTVFVRSPAALPKRSSDSKVAQETSIPPMILAEVVTPDALVQVLEWHWPELAEHVMVEHDLMIEMSLPPLANHASAMFPTLAPGTNCHMGTLFIRYPGLAIKTRAQGGQMRILRCTFSEAKRREMLGSRHHPSLAMMQTLMNIRQDTIRAVMRMMLREVESPHLASPVAAAAHVKLLEIEITRLLDQDLEPKAGGRLAPWQFRRVRERLEAGGNRPSVPELAALCGISVRHLHRQFLNLTGVTISDYVETHLVNQAKTMLGSSALTVKQIAQAAGFDHANSFSRTFRRATGMTPLQYRQQKAGKVGKPR
ncbi:helix-turn-helix transcriptional regulator [Novosphingobium sp.]|uniref:helix-turn-helix transcriptional regulator n=1 Tax=Novosphingobium sp. TaxID=1874826 RepID=UPI0027361105|nr:AraC family transcriptional regulator [Novosphingobium sp.]MDP3907348.1 AraC family transcriptional regulator [Novosphingobium sp.]